jgi:hypothetical protein
MMGGGGGGGGGAFDSNKLIGMAMEQAEKMFDQGGGGSSSLKEKAMSGAAEYAMKMVVKVRSICLSTSLEREDLIFVLCPTAKNVCIHRRRR